MPTEPTTAPTGSVLLDLAAKFDALDHADLDKQLAAGQPLDEGSEQKLERRVELAERIRLTLGDLYEPFERRYVGLLVLEPEHATPAQATLVEMLREAVDDLARELGTLDGQAALNSVLPPLRRLLQPAPEVPAAAAQL